jgi:hypothetical protein
MDKDKRVSPKKKFAKISLRKMYCIFINLKNLQTYYTVKIMILSLYRYRPVTVPLPLHRYTVTRDRPSVTVTLPLPYRYLTVPDRPPLPTVTNRYSPLLAVTDRYRYSPLPTVTLKKI